MNIIYFTGAAQALLLFLLSLRFRSEIHQILFSLLLFALSLHLGLFYLSILFPEISILHLRSFISLNYGPLLFLYIRYKINAGSKFEKKDLQHFLPFILIFTYMSVFLMHNNSDIIRTDFANNDIYKWGKSLIIGSSSVYFYLSFHLLQSYKKRVLNQFSFTEKVGLNWLKWLLFGLIFTWTVIMLIVIINRITGVFNHETERMLIYTALSVFIFCLGFSGIRNSSVFVLPVKENVQTIDVSDIQPDLILYFTKIKTLVETGKLYLKPELNIKEIADRLNINVNYISKAINTVGKQNFFEFINAYRIEEFKTQLTDPQKKNYTLLAIAYECGFNSKASFNRIIKNVTGKTPATLKNSILYNMRRPNS